MVTVSLVTVVRREPMSCFEHSERNRRKTLLTIIIASSDMRDLSPVLTLVWRFKESSVIGPGTPGMCRSEGWVVSPREIFAQGGGQRAARGRHQLHPGVRPDPPVCAEFLAAYISSLWSSIHRWLLDVVALLTRDHNWGLLSYDPKR
eukprot:GFUD01112862.1.p1 GENE.GFUD01112862.1~~GFUD01112862.1.p1  ORF type:complete len:147 (-),score=8.21 GFUD01112862.1:73-513(-)